MSASRHYSSSSSSLSPSSSWSLTTRDQQRKEKEKERGPPSEPLLSASVLLLSPTNQVLLLRRVQTSSAFPSAHVFPGGNLSAHHDGDWPPPGDPERHRDSAAHRLAAIRETFEESGILLARDTRNEGNALLNMSIGRRNKARTAIHENRLPFRQWVEHVGGTLDTENLIPFTRWITPEISPKRFSTQMYIYMLPLSSSTASSPPGSDSSANGGEEDFVIAKAAESEAILPSPDGGVEHTTAQFDDAAAWIEKHRRGEVILFPPQYFLLHIVSQFLTGPPPPSSSPSSEQATAARQQQHYQAQREQLLEFLRKVPTATDREAARHRTARIPWAEKVIRPAELGIRHSDGRKILTLDYPGPDLRAAGRGGDWERVVLARFGKGGRVSDVEVRGRREVLAEARREAEGREEGGWKL